MNGKHPSLSQGIQNKHVCRRFRIYFGILFDVYISKRYNLLHECVE